MLLRDDIIIEILKRYIKEINNNIIPEVISLIILLLHIELIKDITSSKIKI